MGLAGRDIICLSTQFWNQTWFRKQEFMSRFARSNRILFVEPSWSMGRRAEAHLEAAGGNRYFRPRLAKHVDNVFLLKPPRGIPKWSYPPIDVLNHRWYGRIIRHVAEQLGFRNNILWVYKPSYYHALGTIPHDRLVFDLVDDIAAYPWPPPYGAHVEECIGGLVGRSDLLVVTAKTLAERYQASARFVVQVGNGFAAETFRANGKRVSVPTALADLRRPILGFIGTLFSFVDFDLLEEIARIHADKSLVLVGPLENNARAAVARLTQFPNVLYVGERPRAEVPAYAMAFDVCLNPFRHGPAADSVNPLKVYEYLALGRPVVSTPMKALQMEDVSRVIRFAEDRAEFCRQIDECLARDTEEDAKLRRAAAAPYSWDRLFETLEAAVDEAFAA
jgi:glycosyltransferase involved in cell wall biosynthesis